MDLLTVNGFPVLRFAKTGKDEGVVLCVRDTDYEPYVTWAIGWDADGNVSAYWGDYIQSFAEAEKSFLHRTRLYTRGPVKELV